MLVENTKPQIKHIDVMSHHGNDKMPTVKHAIRLMPGVNDVKDEAWGEAKKIKVVQHMLNSGELTEAPLDGPVSLKPGPAIELVKATFDKALLEQWGAVEEREPVKAAIAAQVQEITPSADERKSKK